jgi:type I restriction enzyme S subunit
MFSDIPSAEYIPLEQCCVSITGGNTPSMKHEEYYGGDVPFVKSGDIKDRYVASGTLWLTREALTNTTAKYIPKGTVVVVVRSGILKHDLPVAITLNPLVINQDIKAFQPRSEFTSQYLAWAIRSKEDELLGMTKAMTVDSIDSKVLYSIPVMVASMELQLQFDAFVEQTDKSKYVAQQETIF